MGRIRTTLVKRIAHQLTEKENNEFTIHFSDNKKAAQKMSVFPTKRLRNKVAGYVTRLKRREKNMIERKEKEEIHLSG